MSHVSRLIGAFRTPRKGKNAHNWAVVINSINGLNNVEIRANDAHGMIASETRLRLRRCPKFGANIFFLTTIHTPREVKLCRISLEHGHKK